MSLRERYSKAARAERKYTVNLVPSEKLVGGLDVDTIPPDQYTHTQSYQTIEEADSNLRARKWGLRVAGTGTGIITYLTGKTIFTNMTEGNFLPTKHELIGAGFVTGALATKKIFERARIRATQHKETRKVQKDVAQLSKNEENIKVIQAENPLAEHLRRGGR